MPASEAELAQLKAYVRAMLQLIEAMEARYKVEAGLPVGDGPPGPRPGRIA